MGKPPGPVPIPINWEEFDKLCSYQCTQIELADFFGVSLDTLALRCLKERGENLSDLWNKRKALGRVRLRKAQLNLVEKGGPGAATMAIYLDKKMFPDENPNKPPADPPPPACPGLLGNAGKKTFAQFCVDADYPAPFSKQEEMRGFALQEGALLLLGSRGYGKTDYVVILGQAYEIYLDPTYTMLLITKSDTRNAAIVNEMAMALEKNGATFDKRAACDLRVAGLIGKDHSVSAVTIGTKSLRGRHPKKIIMDDPVTEDDTSAATRRKVQKLYNEASKLTPNVLLIGQPAHKHDLYETLRPILRKLEVPHGTIPELDHDLVLQAMAGVSDESIQASYHLKVVSESGFPLELVDQTSLEELPSGPGVAYLDPSHEGGDYSALSMFKGHFDKMAVKGAMWKKAWNHCVEEIAALLIANGIKQLCIETNGVGDMPVELFSQALPPGIGVVGRKSTKNKDSRIQAAGAYAQRIILVKSTDRTFKEHVVKYELGAEYDDAPDSLATGLEWIGLIRGKQ